MTHRLVEGGRGSRLQLAVSAISFAVSLVMLTAQGVSTASAEGWSMGGRRSSIAADAAVVTMPQAAVTDRDSEAHAAAGGDASGDQKVEPYWCNATSRLIDDIERLGGESVMRVDLDSGRRLEHYWNTTEEVVIEHGADGTSCLVKMRVREPK
ncbi:MAG: hypothetical protein KDJ37_16935 [Hyphomicrobiaceae bacterium]|nr:hypothetical protein [Hyphomicrobiaceae bacterium]